MMYLGGLPSNTAMDGAFRDGYGQFEGFWGCQGQSTDVTRKYAISIASHGFEVRDPLLAPEQIGV